MPQMGCRFSLVKWLAVTYSLDLPISFRPPFWFGDIRLPARPGMPSPVRDVDGSHDKQAASDEIQPAMAEEVQADPSMRTVIRPENRVSPGIVFPDIL